MSKLREVRGRSAVIVAAAVLLGFVAAIPLTGSAAPPPYARARIACPPLANPGDTITVTGTGLPHDSSATFAFADPAVGTVAPTTTTATGTLSTTGTISATSPTGRQVLTATITAPDNSVITESCTIRIH